jgi:hypothetical protein
MKKRSRAVISIVAIVLLLGFVVSLIFSVIYWVL